MMNDVSTTYLILNCYYPRISSRREDFQRCHPEPDYSARAEPERKKLLSSRASTQRWR
jgi:hypothetical protein